jgi:hypothetical protein
MLPNRQINIQELEQCRRIQADVYGVRYQKLSPRQALKVLTDHNQKFVTPVNPFPTTKR